MWLQSSGFSNADEIPLNIILDDVFLDRVNSTKFLGDIMDENLTWKKNNILMQFQVSATHDSEKKNAKIGKVFSLSPSWQIGLATLLLIIFFLLIIVFR